MILSGKTLRDEIPWIVSPFEERSVIAGMSFGCSHAGYDVRIAQDVLLLPGLTKLASTIERFNMPDDVVGIVHDKSTWARRGVTVQNTVLEPGWRGFLTLELVLHRWMPLRIKCGWPIAQIIFHQTDQPCVGYSGKFQDQPDRPVGPRFENPDGTYREAALKEK